MTAWKLALGNWVRVGLWLVLFDIPVVKRLLLYRKNQNVFITKMELMKCGNKIEITLLSGRKVQGTIKDLLKVEMQPKYGPRFTEQELKFRTHYPLGIGREFFVLDLYGVQVSEAEKQLLLAILDCNEIDLRDRSETIIDV